MSTANSGGEGAVRPLLVLVSAVALFAAGGVLLPSGWQATRLFAGGTSGSWLALAAAVLFGFAYGARRARRGTAGARASMARLVLAEVVAAGAILLAPLLHTLARTLHVALWPFLGGGPVGESILGLVTAALVAMPAAAALGMVLASLGEVIHREDPEGRGADGFALGLAAGAAALGMVTGGILLPASLGTRSIVFVAIGLAGVGAAAGALALRGGGSIAVPTAPTAAGATGAAPGPGVAPVRWVALFLAGAGLATALVAWERIAGLLAGPTTVTSVTLLVSAALGLAIGGFLASGLARTTFPWMAALATALGGAAVYLSMQFVASTALTVLDYAPQTVDRPALLSFLAAALLALPGSAAIGVAFAAASGRAPAGGSPSHWFGAAALGALLGAWATALLVVPLYGLRRALAAAAGILLLAAAAALFGAGRRAGLIEVAGAGLLVVAAVGAAMTPAAWDPRVVAGGIYRYGTGAPERFGSTAQWLAARLRGEGPRFYREGSESTVVVERTVQVTAGLPVLETFTQTLDGRSVAGTGTDLRTQVLTGAIPPLLHGAPKRALLVDLLTGVTAGSILTHPVESLTVVEPEPAMVGAAALFADVSNRPLDDARLKLVHDDARARLTTDPARYDLIVVAQPDPSRPGGGALLTAEAYALAKRRLNDGGLFAQRIALGGFPPPALPIVFRTFASAFSSVLVFALTPDDLLLVGAEHPLRLDGTRLREAVTGNPAVADDLRRAVVVGANEVIMTLRLDRDALLKVAGDGPLNVDDSAIVSRLAIRDPRIQRHEGLMASLDSAWPGFGPVLEHYGDTPEAQGVYLYSLAKSYLGIAADPVRALDLARLLDTAGQTAKAHWVRGEALLQEHDLDGASTEWKAVLASEPDNIDALFSLGTFYLDGRDYQLSETYLKHAADTHPDSRVVRYHYGRALYNLGRYERAVVELERATEGEEGKAAYPLAGYFVGLSEWRLGHDDRSIAALKDYLAWAYKQNMLTRVEVDAHLKLAEVYERNGKRFDALQERQKAERLKRNIETWAAQHPSSVPEADPGLKPIGVAPPTGVPGGPTPGDGPAPAPGADQGAPAVPPPTPAPQHGG